MMTYEEAMEALRRADAAGNVEDARRLAEIADRLSPAPPREEAGETPAGTFLRGATTGAVKGLPMIGGAMLGGQYGAALGPWGMGAGALLGGAAGLAAGAMGAKGLSSFTPPGFKQPLTVEEQDVPQEARPYHIAGEVVGGGLPFAGAPIALGRAGARMADIGAGKIVNKILDTAARSPLSFGASELSSLAGAAGAEGVMESQYPGETGKRLGAGIVGGMLTPQRYTSQLARGGWQLARRVREAVPFGAVGKRSLEDRAAANIQAVVSGAGEDVADLARRLQAPTVSGLPMTAGQKTGSPALLAIETKLSQGSAKFGAAAQTTANETMAGIRDIIQKLSSTGRPEDLVSAARIRDSYFRAALSQRLKLASDDAAAAAAKITKDTPGNRALLGKQAETALASTLREARGEERKLWEAVPRDLEANLGATPDGLLAAYAQVRSEILPEESLPHVIEGFVSRMGKQKNLTTSGEMIRFRSRMLDLSRDRAGRGEWNEARIFGTLGEAALADLEATFKGSRAGDSYDAARAFSRELHDVFTRTFAGAALEKADTGAARIPPEILMNRAFAEGKTGGALRLRQMEEAASFLPDKGLGGGMQKEALLDAEQRIARLAAAEAVEPATGRVNPQRLARFVHDNEEILNRFPEIRSDLMDAGTAERMFREKEVAFARGGRIVERAAPFSRIMGDESTVRAVGKVLGGSKPAAGYHQIAAMARRQGPEAVAALRASTLTHAFEKAGGGENFSFAAYYNHLTRPAAPGRSGSSPLAMMMIDRVVTPEVAQRLTRFAKEGMRIERALKNPSRVDDILDETTALTDLVLRIAGSKLPETVGLGKATGSGLVMAHAGSKYIRRMFDKIPTSKTSDIIAEAAQNPQLMAALLKKPKTEREAIFIGQQIHSYLAGAGISSDPTFEDR